MMMRDYKLFTYTVAFTYRDHVRDEIGETTGSMADRTTEFTEKVVAKSRQVADAWIRERHDASYQGHTRFTMAMIEEEDAPTFLIEWTA